MTRDEIERIAAAHSWVQHSRIPNCWRHHGLDMAYTIDEGEAAHWHLTDAGAFRVLVESDLDFYHKWIDHYQVVHTPNMREKFLHPSPHEAVALAELSRLNTRREA